MKKIILVLFTALLLTSCAQKANEVSEISEISQISEVSEISEISVVSEISKEVSKEEPKKVSEISEVSQESKKESSAEVSESSVEIAEYPKEIIEKLVDVDKLGEQTKGYMQKALESENVYMDITGEFALFGGLSVKFNAELARSDSGVMEKFTLGESSVKVIGNSAGTYLIEDTKKKAFLTGEAYDPDEKLQIDDDLTQNSIANDILSQLSSSFGLDMLEYKGSGTENYKGTEYSFEEYSADGKTVKVYFEGDKPVYITSIYGENVSEIAINAINNTPDESLFRVPDGYEIVQ